MRPSLYLLKKQNGRTEITMKTEVQIVVIDLDRSKEYPRNFICVFPQTILNSGKYSNIYGKIFGESSLKIAKKLLQVALKKEKNVEIRAELTKRLEGLKLVHTCKADNFIAS